MSKTKATVAPETMCRASEIFFRLYGRLPVGYELDQYREWLAANSRLSFEAWSMLQRAKHR